MTQSTIIRTVLTADEGKILTNGYVYGSEIILGTGDCISDYHEITPEEYTCNELETGV